MAKPLKIVDVSSESSELEVVSTEFVKITPHLDAKGQKVPGKWDLVKGTVYGQLEGMKRLESAQPLTVVADRYDREVSTRAKRGRQGWPK